MANRLSESRVVDPVLTNIAQGYVNAQYIAENIFPIVRVMKEGFTVCQFGKESFVEWETQRAMGADSNEMQRRDIGKLKIVLEEHDLAYPVDYREKAESMFDEEATAIKLSKDGVDLRRELAAARLVQNPAIYNTGAKVTLSGNAQWSSGGGDPLADIEKAKEVIRSRIGIRPNVIVMGAATYTSLKFHPKLQEALGSNERKLITLDILKALFGVQNIYIGEAVSATKAKGQTGDIWGDNLSLHYVAQAVGGLNVKEQPSFGYTFRKGNPVGDSYPAPGGKVKFMRYTDIYSVDVLFPDAGYLIADVNA